MAELWTETRGSGVPLVLTHGGPGLSDNLAPVSAMVEDIALVHRYDPGAHARRHLSVRHVSAVGLPGAGEAARMRRLPEAERAEFESLERDEPRWRHLLWLTDFASRETGEAVLARGPLFAYPANMEVNHAVQASWKARLDAGFAEELTTLYVPVLVMHGDGDGDPDPVGAREVASLLPRGEWAPLEGAGHSPWLEQPDAVRERLRAFLRSVACTTSA